jgi:hypothetical protein
MSIEALCAFSQSSMNQHLIMVQRHASSVRSDATNHQSQPVETQSAFKVEEGTMSSFPLVEQSVTAPAATSATTATVATAAEAASAAATAATAAANAANAATAAISATVAAAQTSQVPIAQVSELSHEVPSEDAPIAQVSEPTLNHEALSEDASHVPTAQISEPTVDAFDRDPSEMIADPKLRNDLVAGPLIPTPLGPMDHFLAFENVNARGKYLEAAGTHIHTSEDLVSVGTKWRIQKVDGKDSTFIVESAESQGLYLSAAVVDTANETVGLQLQSDATAIGAQWRIQNIPGFDDAYTLMSAAYGNYVNRGVDEPEGILGATIQLSADATNTSAHWMIHEFQELHIQSSENPMEIEGVSRDVLLCVDGNGTQITGELCPPEMVVSPAAVTTPPPTIPAHWKIILGCKDENGNEIDPINCEPIKNDQELNGMQLRGDGLPSDHLQETLAEVEKSNETANGNMPVAAEDGAVAVPAPQNVLVNATYVLVNPPANTD